MVLVSVSSLGVEHRRSKVIYIATRVSLVKNNITYLIPNCLVAVRGSLYIKSSTKKNVILIMLLVRVLARKVR